MNFSSRVVSLLFFCLWSEANISKETKRTHTLLFSSLSFVRVSHVSSSFPVCMPCLPHLIDELRRRSRSSVATLISELINQSPLGWSFSVHLVSMATKDDYQDFKVSLNDLKLNSKPLINHLTFLAEKKVHNASQIVRAIEERIIEVCRSSSLSSDNKTETSTILSRPWENMFFLCCMSSTPLWRTYVHRSTCNCLRAAYQCCSPMLSARWEREDW